ncbi:tetraacyldisaccharide 4'-kinase [Streptosporangium jomthongense]|uniref:Tetraacyldisaccharide 4'-kinase n=1 Tax=Marinobacter aromaticivorans TaxID=1494078 RepID=A0ABW2ITF8_9GAMM|nr:tetraacyldisaccharide 4'-kinase [Marinobacter aromaticivorans]GGE60691.1 tetraacyldisaccharide 4'-kinase [Streptosporangium jomthongense]
MTSLVERLWYGKSRLLFILTPLSWLYRAIAQARRRKAQQTLGSRLPVPVVVVGNITAGGTGKSPLTAWLVGEMLSAGWRPVILSRGYGGKSSGYPLLVTEETLPSLAGDEPVMLAQATGVPVVVDPDRRRGAEFAIDNALGDVFVSDDGLQHYRLPRDIELAVFDGSRGIGNGALIPVGPLREPVSRLDTVDFVVVNTASVTGDSGRAGQTTLPGVAHPQMYSMSLVPTRLVNLNDGETRAPESLRGKRVRAVAGIGNPARFFDTLKGLGAKVTAVPFPDHHRFRPEDLGAESDQILVMTAKDGVKCRGFAPDNAWVLHVEARLPELFSESVHAKLRACSGPSTS